MLCSKQPLRLQMIMFIHGQISKWSIRLCLCGNRLQLSANGGSATVDRKKTTWQAISFTTAVPRQLTILMDSTYKRSKLNKVQMVLRRRLGLPQSLWRFKKRRKGKVKSWRGSGMPYPISIVKHISHSFANYKGIFNTTIEFRNHQINCKCVQIVTVLVVKL